jgi:FkbM family methyltransferase
MHGSRSHRERMSVNMSVKRKVARLLERMTGCLVIPPREVHLGPERVHLRRFFQHFGVDCVFDVGANAGQYASMLRQTAGFAGDIISFEPIPELAAQLRVAAASDKRWFIEEKALDREAGPASFNIMQLDQFSSLHAPHEDQPDIFRDGNKIVRSIPVQRTTLAAEIERYQAQLGFRHPFLKMDTQGNDVAVFEGAGASIATFVGIQSELPIKSLYAGSSGFSEAIAAYHARGFELSAFVPNNEGHFPMLVETDCILYRRGAQPVEAGAN